MLLPCPDDLTFGPVSSCRAFDFTIAFESYILSILPSAVLITFGTLRLFWLQKTPYEIPKISKSSGLAKVAYALKMLTIVACVATQVAALVLWTDQEDGFQSVSLTADTSLALISSLIGLLLSHHEHFRTTQSSLLLPLVLLSTIMCDAVRIRTFAMSGFIHSVRDGHFFAAFCATFAVRCLWFGWENMGKTWLVREMVGKDVPISPESTASFVSRSFFGWATPLLFRGARTQLTLDNLDPLAPELDCMLLWDRGLQQWEKETARGTRYPLVWTLLKAFPSSVCAPLLPCVVYSLAMIARPQAIQDAILFIESYTSGMPEPVENGWGLAGAFFLIYAVYGVAYSWWFLSVNRGAIMIRGFLLEAIYRKSMRIHVEVAKDTGSGKAGSMMALETEKIIIRMNTLYDPLSAFIIVLIGLVMLYKQIGASFVAAILGVLFLSVATPLLATNIGPSQTKWQNLTDKRTKLTGSVLRNIIPVKLSAYTVPLGDKIQSIRSEEVIACRNYWYELMKIGAMTNISANMINLLTLGTYSVVTILDPSAAPLTTARMFTVIAIATVCQPLFNLGQGWASLVSAWTAILRIQEFLLSEEKVESSPSVETGCDVVFQGASFGRGPDTFLHDLTATLPHSKMTFIIGRVGCGKSTFLQACLGEVDLLGGSLVVPKARTAYCSQDTWLRSESARNAITFTSLYDEGRIVQQGSYAALASTAGTMRDLIAEFAVEHRSSANSPSTEGGDNDAQDFSKEEKAAHDDEGRRGSAGWRPYAFYLGLIPPTYLFISGITILISVGLPLATSIYQSYWSAGIVKNPRDGLRRFFGGYVAIEFAYFIAFVIGLFYVFCVAAPVASRRMHEKLLHSVLAAPLSKLEYGGVGKLLNRFGSDIFQVDFSLPNQIVNVTHLLLSCIGSMIIICAAAPWVTLVVFVVVVVFVAIQRFYTRTSQQLRRLDLGSKTPLYGLLSVNADGIRTVRAFEAQEHFRELNTKFVRASQQPYFLMNVSRRWLNSLIGWSIAIINTALVLLACHERLDDQDEEKALRGVWPRRGGILFNNVTARYDSALEPALKGLSFKIRAGDRVGIVGRTGSGKSTTLAALFRMVSLDAGGHIMVDGKDISDLSLDTLRKGMTLIPQDPLLLEMSIRDNLDLEGTASDAEIWEALEKSSMKTVIESLPLKLDEVVSGSGRFSRGQKQLLALARALLRSYFLIGRGNGSSNSKDAPNVLW
ncbi:hypothetical protein RQP46_006260 [Phenoliferia psychrophenolica]